MMWTITDHVCTSCFGRVLRSARGPVVYRCSNCGAEASGLKGLEHPPICACNIRIGARVGAFRCERVEPTPLCPSEVVVRGD